VMAVWRQKSGVGDAITETATAYRELYPQDRLVLWPREPRRITTYPSTNLGPAPAAAPRRSWKDHLKPYARPWLRWHFQWKASRGFDVYHEPNYLMYPTRLPTVLTVHDLSVWLHPEWHPRDRVRWHQDCFPRSVRSAQIIVTDTEAIRQQLLAHFPLSPEQVVSVPLGVSLRLSPAGAKSSEPAQQQWGLPSRYLLAVGTIEPRKNLEQLILAYLDAPRAWRRDCPLWLVGSWGWSSEGVQKLLKLHGPEEGLIHTGYLPDAALPAVYRGAIALLYPSLYEGFGLPPLEMLACGGAVVTSDDPAIQEVTQGRCWTVPARDAQAWRDVIRQILSTPSCLDRYRGHTAFVAREYTWSRTAERMRDVYRRACGT